LSKSVIGGVKSRMDKDETVILCTIYKVSVYAPVHAHTVLQRFSETAF